MTDPRTPAEPGPVDPDLELASAHLDGEAGPDERARAEDPVVRARAAELAAVAERVRDVPAPPAGLLDDHVARALQDFDADATVVPLGRDRKASWSQRIPLGAVAAALVLVALVGVVGLASRAGDDDDAADTATAALEGSEDEAAERSAGAADDAGGTATAGDSGEAMEESATLEAEADMGAPGMRAAYDSYDALADDLRAELGAPAPSAGQTSGTSEAMADDGTDAARDEDPCGAVGLLELDPAAVLVVRTVLVGPELVTVVVHDAEDGRRLVAVDGSCTVVVDRLL